MCMQPFMRPSCCFFFFRVHANSLCRRNVIGGIDGSHIKIPGPDEALLLAYYNYKKFYSIILLAIVDNRGLFRWFTSGAAGSCGDSGVLQATSFYRRAQAELKKPASERRIFADGTCILGDSAFAEGPWMRTPFTLPSSRVERYFKYKHSSMRMRIEHAFGRWVYQACGGCFRSTVGWTE